MQEYGKSSGVVPDIALDLGTKMGFVTFNGPKLLKWGAPRLPTGALGDVSVIGRRYEKIHKLLDEQKTLFGLETCYYEATDWHLGDKRGETDGARLQRESQNRIVARALGRIEGLIESACFVLRLKAVQVTVHEAKRATTGNGNAGKELVAQQVLALYPQLSGETQDTLDAVSVMIAVLAGKTPLWRLELANNNSQEF